MSEMAENTDGSNIETAKKKFRLLRRTITAIGFLASVFATTPSRGQPAPTGACCLDSGGCLENLVSFKCTSAGGVFAGADTVCASLVCTGACCLPEKSCIQTGSGPCGQAGGQFQGRGSVCEDDCPSRLATAFTYQGQLKRGGIPLTDTVDLDFSLWTLETDGVQVGTTQYLAGEEVLHGLLRVDLDFGPTAFMGNSRWLQIVVDGTPLSPRQTLTAAPYAIRALSAGNGHALDAADGSPTQAVSVDNFGNVGIGTTAPANRLSVSGQADISGNVGIGTTDPLAKLDVRGDIRLGSTGQYRAAGGEETLRIVRGIVWFDGSIITGSGFQVTHPSTGHFTITFNTPFASTPTMTATVDWTSSLQVPAFAMIQGSSGDSVNVVVVLSESATYTDRPFHFIAVGPR